MQPLDYEVVQSTQSEYVWNVEGINHEGDGEIYVAAFSGPNSQERAIEYAYWKNTRNI